MAHAEGNSAVVDRVVAREDRLEALPERERLKPSDGEIAAAESSRNSGCAPLPRSSTRLAIRKSASPRNDPPIPLATWSFLEGRVVSPAISQNALPAKVYPSDSQ
jgi:hypothetical protein